MMRRQERDLPELLAFSRFQRQLRRKLHSADVIGRGLVELRRSTRPMVCFVNVQSEDLIHCPNLQRLNLEERCTVRDISQAT
jgi:transposase-like protein